MQSAQRDSNSVATPRWSGRTASPVSAGGPWECSGRPGNSDECSEAEVAARRVAWVARGPPLRGTRGAGHRSAKAGRATWFRHQGHSTEEGTSRKGGMAARYDKLAGTSQRERGHRASSGTSVVEIKWHCWALGTKICLANAEPHRSRLCMLCLWSLPNHACSDDALAFGESARPPRGFAATHPLGCKGPQTARAVTGPQPTGLRAESGELIIHRLVAGKSVLV